MEALTFDVEHAAGAFTLRAAATLDAPVTAVLGRNGAGKTTLLRVLAGLERPRAGRVALGDRVLLDTAAGVWVPPWKRGVGLLFQEPRLWPHRRVRDIVRYGGSWRADEILALTGLEPLLDRRPAGLSGGEQRRVAIARALLARPHALLVDEPLAAVDAPHRAALLALFGTLHDALGIPLVLVTHHVHEALALTRSALLLDQGRLLGAGDLFDLAGDPRAFPVLDGLGLESLLTVDVEGIDPAGGIVRARLGDARLVLPPHPVAPGARARVGLRPEDVLLATGPVDGLSARNALPGTVVELRPVGGGLLVHVDVGQPLRAEITPQAAEELGLRPGVRVWCYAKTWAFRWRAPGPPPPGAAGPAPAPGP